MVPGKAYKMIDNQCLISESSLLQLGGDSKTLKPNNSLLNTRKITRYANLKDPDTNERLYLLEFLPVSLLEKLKLPLTREEFIAKYEEQETFTKANSRDKNLSYIWLILREALTNDSKWKSFVPYYRKYLLDIESVITYAKTHSVFYSMIGLLTSNYSLKQLFSIYSQLPGVAFQTSSEEYFGRKIKSAQENGIPETIIHDFMLYKRESYKLTKLHEKRIKFYYSLPDKLSTTDVTRRVNIEMMDRGLTPISQSTVKRFLNQPEIRNVCDPFRYGEKYAQEKIYSYLTRKEPDRIARVLQIDSTRLQIPYKTENGELAYLCILVVMDVYSRKIIAHALGEIENRYLVLEGLEKALISLRYIPNEIVHDNHKEFYSREFKDVSNRLMNFGVDFRPCRVGNPSDKGHVERWFRTFQETVLKDVFGFVGGGIKTQLKDGRPPEELINFFKKKSNLRDKYSLIKLTGELIEKYNGLSINGRQSPREKFDKSSLENIKEFTRANIIELFWKVKTLKVSNSMIQFLLRKNRYTYTIENRHLINKLNGKIVTVRYNESDLSTIAIFDRNSNQFVCDLAIDRLINVASVLHTTQDKRAICKHYHRLQKTIKDNASELYHEIEEGGSELDSIPVISLSPRGTSTQTLDLKEKKFVLNKVMRLKGRPPMKESVQKNENLEWKQNAEKFFFKRGNLRELGDQKESEQ